MKVPKNQLFKGIPPEKSDDIRRVGGVKLGNFDGNTCLQNFLARFDNYAEYFEWNDSDKLFQMRVSLVGAAGQILWDAGKQSTVSRIIALLKVRFSRESSRMIPCRTAKSKEDQRRTITITLPGRLSFDVVGVSRRIIGFTGHRRTR